MTLEVVLVPLLKDNYAYLVRDPASGLVAVVDPSEPEGVVKALQQRGWTLSLILNTHHHHDHTGGNLALKERYHAKVIGPESDRNRIAGLDLGLRDGESFQLGAAKGVALAVPGHTTGHMVLWFEAAHVAFCGDTLFSLGCGRLFEGTPEEMWASLKRIKALPPDTALYCGHEYTEANAVFALSVDPANVRLRERAAEVQRLRRAGRPTLPTTVALEAETNPFMRAENSRVFADLRHKKDVFKAPEPAR